MSGTSAPSTAEFEALLGRIRHPIVGTGEVGLVDYGRGCAAVWRTVLLPNQPLAPGETVTVDTSGYDPTLAEVTLLGHLWPIVDTSGADGSAVTTVGSPALRVVVVHERFAYGREAGGATWTGTPYPWPADLSASTADGQVQVLTGSDGDGRADHGWVRAPGWVHDCPRLVLTNTSQADTVWTGTVVALCMTKAAADQPRVGAPPEWVEASLSSTGSGDWWMGGDVGDIGMGGWTGRTPGSADLWSTVHPETGGEVPSGPLFVSARIYPTVMTAAPGARDGRTSGWGGGPGALLLAQCVPDGRHQQLPGQVPDWYGVNTVAGSQLDAWFRTVQPVFGTALRVYGTTGGGGVQQAYQTWRFATTWAVEARLIYALAEFGRVVGAPTGQTRGIWQTGDSGYYSAPWADLGVDYPASGPYGTRIQ